MSLINIVNECMPGQGRESAPICRAQIIHAVQEEINRIQDCSEIGEYEKNCYVQHVLRIARELVVQQKRQAFMATAAGFLTELSKTVLHTQKD